MQPRPKNTNNKPRDEIGNAYNKYSIPISVPHLISHTAPNVVVRTPVLMAMILLILILLNGSITFTAPRVGLEPIGHCPQSKPVQFYLWALNLT